MSLRLTPEFLKDGMVTEQPVINRFGQTVLAAGIVLNARHIEVFKAQGIAFVEVEGGPGAETLPVTDAMRTAAAEHLRKRMDWEPHLPLEKEVFQITVETLAERMARKGGK